MAKIFSTLLVAALCAAPTLLLAQADAMVGQPGIVAQNNTSIFVAPIGEVSPTSGTSSGGTDTTTHAPTPTISDLAIMSGRYVTLREATHQHLTFFWKLGANIDNIKVTVRRNNMIVATRILLPTDSVCTVYGIAFNDNDILQVSVAARAQLLRFSAKYKRDLQDNAQARATVPTAIRPLATVESIHPRRRNHLRTATTLTTAPGVNECVWANNTDINGQLYYKISDVSTCVQAETTDSVAFYTCLEAHSAYFTFDSQVYMCGAANDGTNPNRSAKPRVTEAYPNPFQHEVNIKCRLAQDATFLTIYLADIRGNTVYTHQMSETTKGDYVISIPTAGLPQGIYFYTISSNGFAEKGRVIKM